jgi:hypothetical protein
VQPEPSAREQADLAALADGTLPEGRRPAVEADVAASPVLQEALARQRASLAAVRTADEDRAPEHLRAWLAGQEDRAGARTQRRRAGLRPRRGPSGRAPNVRLPFGRRGVAAAGLAAVAALALLFAFTGPDGPGTAQLAEAAARPASAPAPARAGNLRLAVASDGIPFPDWAPRMGWRATGMRSDKIDGRRSVTVTYTRGDRTVAYAILARPALDLPNGAGDGAFHGLRHGGHVALAWHRDGRTCLLLGGKGVDEATLRRLADTASLY